jgi:CheY-like chemotaxis protein
MNTSPDIKIVEILLVEDSPSDVLLTKRALTDAKMTNRLHVVQDGVEAMAFLHREPPHTNAPRPDLILLDLNLPKKSGTEVLMEIKTDEALSTIPVCILTTSQEEQDIIRSYKFHANCYIVKPVDFDAFAQLVKALENFWFTIVTLPK